MHWWTLLWTVFAWTQVQAFVTTIYLHRGLSHRAISMVPGFDLFLKTVLRLGTDVVPLEWVSVHRKHHAFADMPEDPHSPIVEGMPLFGVPRRLPRWIRWLLRGVMWLLNKLPARLRGLLRVQFLNSTLYTREANNVVTLKRYGWDMGYEKQRDWLDRHRKAGWPIMSVAFITAMTLVHGWWGILEGALVPPMTLISYIIMSACINGLGHVVGYRNDKRAVGRNVPILNFFTAGEALHNNHHSRAVNANFRQRFWEIDPAWPVIKILSWVGLVKVTHEQKKITEQRIIRERKAAAYAAKKQGAA